MATVQEVARDALSQMNSNAPILECARWVADRYRRIAARGRFRHLRQISYVIVPAVMSTGTISIATNGTVATGDATAVASWLTPSGGPTATLVGRYIRFNIVWYLITAVDTGLGTITISSPYTESTTITAHTYTIAAQRVALGSDVRWIQDFAHMRRRELLFNISYYELIRDVPDRPMAGAGGGPYVWSEVGVNATGSRLVEFYPYPSQDETIACVYWQIPPTLGLADTIPPQIDQHTLMEGVMIDVMRWEANDAMRTGQVEQATYWRNEYRAQTTSWETQLHEALRTDHGVDDITQILQLPRNAMGWPRGWSMTNAHDIAYGRWPL